MHEILTVNKTKQSAEVKYDPRKNVYSASVGCGLCATHFETSGATEQVAVEHINLDLIKHHQEAHGLK